MKYVIACLLIWFAILTIARVLGLREQARCHKAGGKIVYGICIDKKVIL